MEPYKILEGSRSFPFEVAPFCWDSPGKLRNGQRHFVPTAAGRVPTGWGEEDLTKRFKWNESGENVYTHMWYLCIVLHCNHKSIRYAAASIYRHISSHMTYTCLCRSMVYDLFSSEMIFGKIEDYEAETDDENHHASSSRSKVLPYRHQSGKVDPWPKTQYLRRISAGKITTPQSIHVF